MQYTKQYFLGVRNVLFTMLLRSVTQPMAIWKDPYIYNLKTKTTFESIRRITDFRCEIEKCVPPIKEPI